MTSKFRIDAVSCFNDVPERAKMVSRDTESQWSIPIGVDIFMKTIINKTGRPLKITLSQGRVLRLGPRKEGQIATPDAERESVKKMIAVGEVSVFDEVSRTGSRSEKGPGGALRSQGRGRRFLGSTRGER